MRFIIVLISIILFMSARAENCRFDTNSINDKVLKLVFVEKVEDAHLYLERQKKCIETDYEKAVYNELLGFIWSTKYSFSKKIEDAKVAFSNYEQAYKLGTEHENIVLLRLALLMKKLEKYNEAAVYINKVLKKNPKQAEVYLAAALDIAVELGNWADAKDIVNILFNSKQEYFLAPHTLYSSVRVLCHYDKYPAAKKFVAFTKENRKEFTREEQRIMDKVDQLVNKNKCGLLEH